MFVFGNIHVTKLRIELSDTSRHIAVPDGRSCEKILALLDQRFSTSSTGHSCFYFESNLIEGVQISFAY